MNNKAEIFDWVRMIARMNRLGDMIDDGTGEKYPYQPDGCGDSDAQALYRLIDKAREWVAAEANEPPRFEAYRKAAKQLVKGEEGNVEVDDTAGISEGDDDGAYVEAWLWVSNDEAGITTEEATDTDA